MLFMPCPDSIHEAKYALKKLFCHVSLILIVIKKKCLTNVAASGKTDSLSANVRKDIKYANITQKRLGQCRGMRSIDFS